MSPVVVLPRAAEPLLSRLGIAFTPRTFQRVLLLFVESVLAPGRHTVTRALWAAHTLAAGSGHFTNSAGWHSSWAECNRCTAVSDVRTGRGMSLRCRRLNRPHLNSPAEHRTLHQFGHLG